MALLVEPADQVVSASCAGIPRTSVVADTEPRTGRPWPLRSALRARVVRPSGIALNIAVPPGFSGIRLCFQGVMLDSTPGLAGPVWTSNASQITLR